MHKTFILKDSQSIAHFVEIFNTFPLFQDKPNLIKCEMARLVALKGVKLAVCGMKCNDLRNEAIKF